VSHQTNEMAPSIRTLLYTGITIVLTITPHATLAKSKQSKQICSDSNGIYLALAIDTDSYTSVPGAEQKPWNHTHPDHQWNSTGHHDRDSHHNGHHEHPHGAERDPSPQQWSLTGEGDRGDGPVNSIGGSFLQVLPDTGRRYPGNHGSHITSADELDGDSPYLSFWIRVEKERAGWHTLFVRWTGGDDIGGGDSFYVVMKNKDGSVVTGQRTLKPAVVPIDSESESYVGCCYDETTHACPCYHEIPDEDTCPLMDFISKERAVFWKKDCSVGKGAMDIIDHPEWYLYSGQEDGNVMDFKDEPWDATCEANGSSTADSGHDYPEWNLAKGEYELRIYAREDGTALDGIYLAGPDGVAPSITHEYAPGDSTLCKKDGTGWKVAGIVVGVLGMAGLVAFFMVTDQGQEVMHLGKLMVGRMLHRESAPDNSSGYGYEVMDQFEG